MRAAEILPDGGTSNATALEYVLRQSPRHIDIFLAPPSRAALAAQPAGVWPSGPTPTG